MKLKIILVSFFFFLTGCATKSEQLSNNYMHFSNGGKSIEANSINPRLKCEEKPRYARLDKPYEERVYILESGEVCK